MKITLCASIAFTNKIKEVADILLKQGHSVEIPYMAKKILDGDISLEEYLKIKQKVGDIDFRNKAEEDLIKRYYRLIKESDAILVLNIDKEGNKNYVGGNTFLEMGFAYILNKKVFLLNDIPDTSYKDEIVAMQPIILNGDLSKIN